MSDFPSEVKDRNYVRMPLQEKVIESDEEWSRCGKWILYNPNGRLSWIDDVWTKLKILLNNGTLIMIKASTAAMKNTSLKTVNSSVTAKKTGLRRLPGVVLCFTRPGVEELKRAAEEIRKIVDYKSSMYYKINSVTENEINIKNGHSRISEYMYTYKGFLYKKSDTEGWHLLHPISYAMNSQQANSTQVSVPAAELTGKRLRKIDPLTGKDILQENVNEETPSIKEEYQHQRYPGTIMQPGNYLFYRSNFNNTPHVGANGYYQHHQIYYAMNGQQVNSIAPAAQPTKKRLGIIDPLTGKDILQENFNEEAPSIKEEENNNENSSCARSNFLLEKREFFNSGDVLPSRSNRIFLEMKSDRSAKMSELGAIYTRCSMEEDEDGLTQADRLWIVGKKLLKRGCLKRIIYYKSPTTAGLRFFPAQVLDYTSFVKVCDILREEADYWGFMYFKESEKKIYRYSPEGELYIINPKSSDVYIFDKKRNQMKSL